MPSGAPAFPPCILHRPFAIEPLRQGFALRKWGSFKATQCEVTYVNQISVFRDEKWVSASEYIKLINTYSGTQPEEFNFRHRRIIFDRDQKPIGRLYTEAVSAIEPTNQQPVTQLSFIGRGAPVEQSIEGIINFMGRLREEIVVRFAEVTTESAQAEWGRTQ